MHDVASLHAYARALCKRGCRGIATPGNFARFMLVMGSIFVGDSIGLHAGSEGQESQLLPAPPKQVITGRRDRAGSKRRG